MTDSESALDSPPISITSDEISIGSNPDKATLVLEDPSIEGLHARLVHAPDGAFRLFDQGSIAGTWVNFGPVPADGATLQHGDIVHFGRIGFRFTVHAPGPVLKPNIIEDGELHSDEESGRDPGNPLEMGLESSQDSTSESEQEAEESTP